MTTPNPTTDIDALIERLKRTRPVANSWGKVEQKPWNPDGPEAATALATLRAQVEAMAALLAECATDLEAEVQARWGYDERLSRQLNRDLDVVVRSRAALAAYQGD